MQRDTTHLCIVNAGHRPAKIVKDTVIAIYAPVTTNTAYAYLNVTDMSIPNSKGVALGNGPVELPVNAIDEVDNTDAQTYNIIPVEPLTEVSPARFAESKIDELQDTLGLGDTKSSGYPMSVGDVVPRSLSDEVKETMDVRDIDLSWQPGIDETVDPFGLKAEFKEKGPILDQPSDSDKEPYDIAWDICPDLTRKESVDGERNNADGDMEYLIRWKGYGMTERTWEPLVNLEHAGEAIATWNAGRVDGNSARPIKKSLMTVFPRRLHPNIRITSCCISADFLLFVSRDSPST